MKTYRAAIIGLGKIGFEQDASLDKRYVITYARALSMHKGFKLVRGFDIDARRRNAFEKKYKVPACHYRELKENLSDIDLVVIAVPARNHFEVFKKVASCSSLRMVIVEKPLALDLKQARQMLAISKKKRFLLYVNYFRRVDPGIRRLKQCIERKKWAGLRHVNIYYGRGLLNNGSHFIDLITFLLGQPDCIKLLRKNGSDNPDFIFCYKQLSVYFKSCPYIDYNLKEMDFVFKEARVRYLSLPATQLLLPEKKSCFGTSELVEVGNKGFHLDLERYMFTVIEHIYNVLSGEAGLESSGQAALHTLKLCFEVMKKGAC